METSELHRRAAAGFDHHVQAVADDDWRLPTPNTEWDVRALVNHLTYENKWCVPLLQGSTVEEVGDAFEGDLLGAAPKEAWSQSLREAEAAVQAEGALERTVHLSSRESSGEEYVFELFIDLLIHSWDLARGIGGDERLDDDLVKVCYEKTKSQEQMIRDAGVFGSHVEPGEDADLQTRLLALFGRTA